MREIKFRAWDKLQKKMLYKALDEEMRCLFHNEPVCTNQDKKCKEESNYIGFANDCPIFDYMQYIGLKDKNGKEIYEGDILFNEGVTFNPYIVKYIDGAFAFTKPDSNWIHWLHDANSYTGIMEIVSGNIYENPELLKP